MTSVTHLAASAQSAQQRVLQAHGDHLFRVLLSIFLVGGFGAVVTSCHAAQKRIAETHRKTVDGEGWIV